MITETEILKLQLRISVLYQNLRKRYSKQCGHQAHNASIREAAMISQKFMMKWKKDNSSRFILCCFGAFPWFAAISPRWTRKLTLFLHRNAPTHSSSCFTDLQSIETVRHLHSNGPTTRVCLHIKIALKISFEVSFVEFQSSELSVKKPCYALVAASTVVRYTLNSLEACLLHRKWWRQTRARVLSCHAHFQWWQTGHDMAQNGFCFDDMYLLAGIN